MAFLDAEKLSTYARSTVREMTCFVIIFLLKFTQETHHLEVTFGNAVSTSRFEFTSTFVSRVGGKERDNERWGRVSPERVGAIFQMCVVNSTCVRSVYSD